MGRNWQLVINRKPIFYELCWEASSKRNHCGDVAQMVERSLSMREVRGSMPRISKTFFRIRQFCFLIGDIGKELTTLYKWKTVFMNFVQKLTRSLKSTGMYLKWSSARFACERYGNRRAASPKHFWEYDNSGVYLLIMELTTRYKSKADFSWIVFRS